MKKLLLLLIFSFIGSLTFGQSAQKIIGKSDRWLFGNLTLGKVFGQIGEATPGGYFGNESLLDVLLRLQSQSGGEAEIQKTFTEFVADATQWIVPIESGKKFDPDGFRIFEVAGMDYTSNYDLIYGVGNQQTGILLTTDDLHPWLTGWHGFAYFQLLDFGAIDFTPGDWDISVASDLHSEILGGLTY